VARDPQQVRLVTFASLRWIVRHRAWSWWYLVRYWRYLWLRVRHPHVVTTGMVFLGRGVQISARRGYGRIVLGRWVHLGDGNRLRCHEGTLRIGDKCVFGQENTVNCYLDIEIGAAGIIADWVYICDFDHVTDDIHRPIKDQGIVKSPVRIGSGAWIGVKASVLRGSVLGAGTVVAAHAVVRGTFPDNVVVGGIPATIIKDRVAAYEAQSAVRVALEDIARKTERAAIAQVEHPGDRTAHHGGVTAPVDPGASSVPVPAPRGR
jgi:acetyltransferase-like isoleucine patch superfamily enzyme